MNCWRVQNLIAPFLDDELPDTESELVVEHLEQCAPCRDLVEGVAALPDLPKIELEADLASGLWSEFDRCLGARLEAFFFARQRSTLSYSSPSHGHLRWTRSIRGAMPATCPRP